ncbi:MAG: sulfatase [Myxococcota bacterium]|nr:sulfatase [Myxococcota bacterium]
MLRQFLDSPWPYFVGAGLLLLVAIATQFEMQLPSRPTGTAQDITKLRERGDLNVVFVLIDTLRADRLGAYGYERPTSPNIDALASSGILFQNALAQSSWTKTSMASIWTGTYPANNGIIRYNDVMPEEARMPAEVFREAGYRTAGIWRNGWVAPNFGFSQGFEFYLNPKPGRERQRAQGRHPAGGALKGTDEDIVTSAFEFIDNFGRERFFLYLHFMDLHQYVYDEASARFGTSYSDVYDQSINWTDRLIGLIVERIDSIGALPNTIFVIASDHGEAFQEHGIEGHARNLYSEVVNVPIVISLPFMLEGGIVVKERVLNVDIWPTVFELIGLPPLPATDGRSLVPLVMAAAAGREDGSFARPAIAHLDRRWGTPDVSDPLVSVTEGDKRLLWMANRPAKSRLFDLAQDPAEKTNLYDPEDPEATRLEGLARRYYEEAENPWGVEPKQVELDELRLNQLRALGYVIR